MSPARGGRARDASRGAGTRLVWPASARTENARATLSQILREAGMGRGFDASIEREAEQAAERSWENASRERRVDLRSLPTFTVDPATARDFDDAISATHESDGSVRVWVHIADVAAHVSAGSALDLEARRRSNSVYLPGIVEPMLPPALSSDACSLLPGAERLAVTVELLLRDARVERASFYRSIICSDERLDYERVDRIFASGEAAPASWGEPLAAARAAAAALQSARERSGALVIDSAEPEVHFDDRGNVTEILPRAQTESHRLIEHLMIAANESVARQLMQTRTSCLYRVHERPDPERIRRLVVQLDSLGVPTPPLPDQMFSTQAAELVGEISRRIDRHVQHTRTGRRGLSLLLLRSLTQAYYSPHNLGHSGLRSNCYCHFTSPIRRYPDLVCHRALLASLGAGEATTGRRRLVELGEWASEREREAATLEHRGDDVASCFLLEQILFEKGYEHVFFGEVTGVIRAGVFVSFGGDTLSRVAAVAGGGRATQSAVGGAGEDVFEGNLPGGGDRARAAFDGAGGNVFEGMLPVRFLGGKEREWWSLNECSTILRAERSGAAVRLGDPIAVRVVRVDPLGGRVDLAPAG